jgi:peptide/nickel transport system substrate-binding protein
MTIERDPNYYRGWGEGPIDEVRFIITNDEATVRSMAASGELTMSSQYQSPDTYDALSKMPRFKIVTGVTPVAFYLKFNSKVAQRMTCISARRSRLRPTTTPSTIRSFLAAN